MHGRSGDRAGTDNRYPVPDGFRQLLEALAREVLRGQPDDIYAFSALFFKVLLDMRGELNGENPIQRPELYDKFKRRLFASAAQESLVSPALLSAFPATNNAGKAVSRAGKEAGGSKEDLDIDLTDPDLNKAAMKIQATYRGFATRQHIDKEIGHRPGHRENHHAPDAGADPDRAATKIQANIRGYLTRKHYKEGTLKPAPRPPKKKNAPKRPTTLDDEAASKIQAGIRGYLTRKELEAQGIHTKSPASHTSRSPASHASRSPAPGDEHTPTSPDVDPDIAASKIQAGVRGYLTRKQLAARGYPVHSPPHHHSHELSHQQAEHHEHHDLDEDEAAAKIQAGIRGYLTRKHLEHEGLRKSPARNVSKETRRVTIANVDDAATKIQAGIRGYLTRKHLEAQGIHIHSGGVSPSSSSSPIGHGGIPGQHNHVGDDGIGSPGDAEEAAATKIQAAFRGHMVRQQMHDKLEHEHEDGEFI